MSSESVLFSPFTFACGKTVQNRVVKAAMEENMAGLHSLPGSSLLSLYRYWAHGNLGMIITGNVMVDRNAMTGPGGVVLDANTHIAPFQQWAKVAKSGGALAVMQINHPGRQVFKSIHSAAKAPSDVPVKLGKRSNMFAPIQVMTSDDIHQVCAQFVLTAVRAAQAGFDGVEIHAAHGYLLTQFLSPLTNQRDDEWGGCLRNRARLLINIVSQIRARCPKDFLLMVKLNSADFQHGGFEPEDAYAVVGMLEGLGVDCIELSGGSYEAPAMQGQTRDSQTLAREAYFLDFARKLAARTVIPVMTTGGVKRLAVAERVIEQGCALVGMASALATTPDLVKKWQRNPDYQGVIPRCRWRDKTLASLANMAMVRRQLRRLGSDMTTIRHPSAFWSLLRDQFHRQRQTRRLLKHR